MARRLLKRNQAQALCKHLQRLVENIPDSGQDALFLTKLGALAITIEQTEVPDEINVGPYSLSKSFSQLLEQLWRYVCDEIPPAHPDTKLGQ
jgi:hypothetical protein